MNEFGPRGYVTLEEALEHFGRLKHANEWEAEKASSKREFQQLLFAADLPAVVLTNDGALTSLRSSIWGSVEAERIIETGRASISVGDYYFPATVDGPVLIKKSSIDALSADDSDGPSQSPEAISDGALTTEVNDSGRPSLRTEIENAYRELISNGTATLDSRKPNYEPIRQIIRRELGLPPGASAAGLGDEAIRKVIAPILDNALAALNEAKTASH